jgi:hypothetical protein
MVDSRDDEGPFHCKVCGPFCCGLNGLGQCNGAYEGLCHVAWEKAYGLPPNVDDIGEALMARRQGRAIQLRVRITRQDGEAVGHPERFTLPLNRVQQMISAGARSGVFELDLNGGDHGELGLALPRRMVTVDFDVIPSDPYVSHEDDLEEGR